MRATVLVRNQTNLASKDGCSTEDIDVTHMERELLWMM